MPESEIPALPGRSSSGQNERHLARGAIVQQVSQVFGTLIALAVITVLGRTLTLSEFGIYGLVVGTTNYLLIVQGSVESSVVRAVAIARHQNEINRIFSNAILLYLGAGLLSGSIVCGGGWILIGILEIPAKLQFDARVAVILLGVVMVVGWPLRVFHALLRGSQRFVDAALAEIAGLAAFGGVLIGLGVTRMPLWLLMGVGGGLPALIGLASFFMARRRIRFRFTSRAVEVSSLRELGVLAGYLLILTASDLVIYALDRIVLAAFRGASAVGLYEGPARLHNFLQTVQSTLSGTVLPAATSYYATENLQRLRDLMLRGTRYVLVVTLPLTITIMALARPLLVLWLGKKFGTAATAATILIGYWLITANQAVPWNMMVASGYARWLARYAWMVALMNLAASILLTWQFGLNGVVLGTSISFLLTFPIFLAKASSTLHFTLGDLVGAAWIPSYSIGAIIAGGLIAIRLLIGIDNLGELIALLVGSPMLYWCLFYMVWATPGERGLVQDIFHETWSTIYRPSRSSD